MKDEELEYIELFEERAAPHSVFAYWDESGNYSIMSRESARSEYVEAKLHGDTDADHLITEARGFDSFTGAKNYLLKALLSWKSDIQLSVNILRFMKKKDME